MRLHRGNAGWHRITGDTGFPGQLYARFTEVDGALRLTELYVDGRGEPISAAALRNFPVRMAEETARYLDGVGPESHAPGPDLSRLATFFSTTFGVGEGGEPLRRDWVADSMHAQVNPRVQQVKPVPMTHVDQEEPVELSPLQLPESRELTDEFLTDVADRYRQAVSRRLPPARSLSELTGVSQRTVQGWFAKARRRGLLEAPASRGRIV